MKVILKGLGTIDNIKDVDEYIQYVLGEVEESLRETIKKQKEFAKKADKEQFSEFLDDLRSVFNKKPLIEPVDETILSTCEEDNSDDILTLKKVAKFLKILVKDVLELVHNRKIPHYILPIEGFNPVRFRLSDIQDWLDDNFVDEDYPDENDDDTKSRKGNYGITNSIPKSPVDHQDGGRFG